MNDLPTRYDAAVYVRSTFSKDNDALIPAIMRAYADGRLVDRDQIDYEAAAQALFELDESSEIQSFVDAASRIVDAACGQGGG